MKNFRRSKDRRHVLDALTASNGLATLPVRHYQPQLPEDRRLLLPHKVIKALYDYAPQGPGELKFTKGDFFHLVREDDEDWFEASNPVTGARGMVPRVYFEVIGRTRPSTSGTPKEASRVLLHLSVAHAATNLHGTLPTLYARVMYDFKAERPEELDVHAGENLIICAHHDREWFITKPIGRLGGPGLVPVSYVKVIDFASGQPNESPVEEIIAQSGLPLVKEWKDKNAKYKASSIPLGDPTLQTPEMHQSLLPERLPLADPPHVMQGLMPYDNASLLYLHPTVAQHSTTTLPGPHPGLQMLSGPYVVEVSVESFALYNDEYWYLVKPVMLNGTTRLLCRYYGDFYSFQIKLLDTFPDEAGRTTDLRRVLPFIPGPLVNVNESISAQRRKDFDVYVKKLVALPEHISQLELVSDLFALHEGDREFPTGLATQVPNPERPMGVGRSERHTTDPDFFAKRQLQRLLSRVLTYQQDRLSQYLDNRNLRNLLLNEALTNRKLNPGAGANGSSKKVKVKIYYVDDIYAMFVLHDTDLRTLKAEVQERLGLSSDHFHIYERRLADLADAYPLDDALLPQVLAGDKVKLAVQRWSGT